MANEMKTLTIGSDTFKVVDGDAVHVSDRVVFTMDADTMETTCDKTYAECLELVSNNNCDAVMILANESVKTCIKSVFGMVMHEDVMYGFANSDISASGAQLTLSSLIVTPDGVVMN